MLVNGGVSPHVMEMACGVPQLTAKVAEVLDQQHLQKLPPFVHLKELVKRHVQFKIKDHPIVPPILQHTDPSEIIEEWKKQNKNR